jgi:uncharacterized protein with GYD domain
MPAFVTLYNYRGSIEGGGPERFKKIMEIVAEEKGEILQVYGLLGPYDIVSVSRFPDNTSAMKAAARVGKLINAKTLTMPAVERDDFLKLISEV